MAPASIFSPDPLFLFQTPDENDECRFHCTCQSNSGVCPSREEIMAQRIVMRSGDIRRKRKIMLYKTLIRSVPMWVLPQKLDNALRTFERKILRRIFGPVNDNGQRRIQYIREVCELYKEPGNMC
jgi:hypothetical protein